MPLGTALRKTRGGKALAGGGGVKAYQHLPNSECRGPAPGSETMCAKVHGREGNSPDRRLRSQSHAECEMRFGCTDSQEVGSEAAIP